MSYRTMAEGVGNAPTSARADPVFETGAASLYLPAFREMVRVARLALASSSFRTCGRVLAARRKMPLPVAAEVTRLKVSRKQKR